MKVAYWARPPAVYREKFHVYHTLKRVVSLWSAEDGKGSVVAVWEILVSSSSISSPYGVSKRFRVLCTCKLIMTDCVKSQQPWKPWTNISISCTALPRTVLRAVIARDDKNYTCNGALQLPGNGNSRKTQGKPLHSRVWNMNSPYCLPYPSSNVSSENLVIYHENIPLLMNNVILITYLPRLRLIEKADSIKRNRLLIVEGRALHFPTSSSTHFPPNQPVSQEYTVVDKHLTTEKSPFSAACIALWAM